MQLKLPSKNRRVSLPPPRSNNSIKAPLNLKERARLPSIWHRELAGVTLTTAGPTGAGQRALDEVCKENSWTWGVVATYLRNDEGQEYLCTSVIIGTVVEGAVQRLPGKADEARCWNEHDQALGNIAERLRKGHG